MKKKRKRHTLHSFPTSKQETNQNGKISGRIFKMSLNIYIYIYCIYIIYTYIYQVLGFSIPLPCLGHKEKRNAICFHFLCTPPKPQKSQGRPTGTIRRRTLSRTAHFAGLPAQSSFLGTRQPGGTTVPAAICPPASITEPSATTAPAPMRHLG